MKANLYIFEVGADVVATNRVGEIVRIRDIFDSDVPVGGQIRCNIKTNNIDTIKMIRELHIDGVTALRTFGFSFPFGDLQDNLDKQYNGYVESTDIVGLYNDEVEIQLLIRTTDAAAVFESPDKNPVFTLERGGIYDVEASGKAQLEYTIEPSDYLPLGVVFESSDEDVVTVSTTGEITGVTNGLAKVYMRVNIGREGKAHIVEEIFYVNVGNQVPAEDISLILEGVKVGGTETLSASLLPVGSYGSIISYSVAEGDEDIIQIENGVLTALSAGIATIIVTIDNGWEEIALDAEVEVTIVELTAITVTPSYTINTTDVEPTEVTYTTTPQNAHVETAVLYIVSGTGYVSVDGLNITPIAAGLATLLLTVSDGINVKTAEISVTVE